MKKILLTFGGLLLITIAGFYIYSINLKKNSPASLWDFVPPDAVIIYENKKPSYPPRNLPDFATWFRSALRQDSIFISPARSTEIITSLHITGKQDFGILFYQSDSSLLNDKTFRKLIAPGKIRYRTYEGYTITELPSRNNKTLSYTTIGANLILSRESFLIENVIRSLQPEDNSFKKKNNELFHLLPTDAGQGKIYASIKGASRFFNIFLNNEIKSIVFKNAVSTVITDARIENQTLSLNGFALDSLGGQPSLLSLFNHQRPVGSEIQKIVSNRTMLFVHCGIPDYPAWNKRRLAWSTSQRPDLLKSITGTAKKTSLTQFYQYLGAEAGYCMMPGARGQTDDILILSTRDKPTTQLIQLLSGDQPPIENYSSYAIYPLTSSEFMFSALWPINENKNLTCYTKHNRWLLFAENTEILKGFINDMEEDNIWGKSPEWNTFFNSTSLETNLTMEFNGALLTPWLKNKLAVRWDTVTFPHPAAMLDKGAVQFSRLNYNYYFNGVLQFDSRKKRSTSGNTSSTVPNVSFPEDITSLTQVKNHNDNSPELLVQTADKNVMLLAPDFKVLFTTKLSEKITSAVTQVDYYRNRKLQYAFLAGHALHLIDRLGNEVKGFPRTVETPSEIEYLSVIDYDNTRNYRFFMADQKGNLIMMDKEGALLDGWEKQTTKLQLASAPRLIRVASKDYLIAVDVAGTITVFNRKGEVISGFPVTTGIHPQGDWFFDKSGGEGLITLISTEGVRIQVSLKGKISNKDNFVRSASDSKFSLIVSPALDDYAVSRTDRGKIAVLNRKGEILFEKENPGSDALETAFRMPAPGERVFCFRDPQQDFTYLFTEQGQQLFSRPLESSMLPVVTRRAKEGLIVFTPLNNQIKKEIQ